MEWNKEKLTLLKGLKLANARGISEEQMYCLYFSRFASILYTYAVMYSLNYSLVSNTADIKNSIWCLYAGLGRALAVATAPWRQADRVKRASS